MKTFKLALTQNVKQHSALFILAGFGMALLLIRAKLAHSFFYFFLPWNLLLAYIPLAVSTLLKNEVQLIENTTFFIPLSISWLLLLPNAPYIITDFIHLTRGGTIPVWFDTLLLITFSVAGLLFGLTSMTQMFRIFTIKYNVAVSWLMMCLSALLSGLGIYIGRFLRFNSWDAVQKPLVLSASVLHSLTDAETVRAAWGITLGFGGLFFLLFHIYYTSATEKNL